MTVSKRVCSIAGVCLRRNLPVPLLLCLLLLAFGFLFVGPAYWEALPAASFQEMLVALTGPLLLTPLFLPEQDPAVADVLRARRTSFSVILTVRAVCSLLFALLLPALAILLLAWNHNEILPGLWLGTISSSLLLGGLGAFAYSLSGNIAAAYMAPALYYALGMVLGRKLGIFNPFLLSSGQEGSKLPQLLLGLALLASSIPLWCRRKR